MKKIFWIFLILLSPQQLLAEANYSSKALKTMEFEEMRDLINQYIQQAQAHLSEDKELNEESLLQLKKGLKVLLMRPDTDSTKASLLVSLQNEITKYKDFISVLKELISESIEEFKAQKSPVEHQASLLYVIENSLSHLKSVKSKQSSEILTSIQTAKLEIPEEVSNYLLLEMGRGKTASPSYLAKQILTQREKELAEEAKKHEEAKKKAEKAKEKEENKGTKDTKKEREPSSQEPEAESSSQETNTQDSPQKTNPESNRKPIHIEL